VEEIRTVSIKDKEYPHLLKKIPDPPKTLYIRGVLQPSEIYFAVVGTRRFSPYGKQTALKITGDLAQAGLTIVSGLAQGIDTFAHLAALEQGARTIAVLGTGIDDKSIYPKENLKLAKRIVKNGALISEYPVGTPGFKQNFPQRNRLISGMSKGVLVVEAKQKSGALITADHAFLQNRKVFAVPGSIFSSNSKGPHNLIKKGARLADSADDILKELGIVRPVSKNKQIIGKNREEQLIINSLKEQPLHIDKIIEITRLTPAIVNSTLAVLEIDGKVRNLGGNVYGLC